MFLLGGVMLQTCKFIKCFGERQFFNELITAVQSLSREKGGESLTDQG